MRAIVQDVYGPADVLHLRDMPVPAIADDEVLLRVRAASLHADVWHATTGLPYILRLMGSGFRRPVQSVPGTDAAGIVEAVGRNVTRFSPGDEVFGESLRGHQWRNGGTFAEYAAVPESGLARKPANIPFEQAAAVPTSALIALMNLRAIGRLQPGQRVLINGAGGGVGSVAVQLAQALGGSVTAVDATDKQDLLRALGADHVIDYTRDDFTRGPDRYDLIFDIPGNHGFLGCRRALTPTGRWVLIGHDDYGRKMRRWTGLIPYMMVMMTLSVVVKQLPRPDFSEPDKAADMELFRSLLEQGRLTPVVDSLYPLERVPDAMRRMQAGGVKGKIVITM